LRLSPPPFGQNLRREQMTVAKLPARQGPSTAPCSGTNRRTSVFKHVVYVIKENRTYDRFSATTSGAIGPFLCIFGARPPPSRPNQHKWCGNLPSRQHLLRGHPERRWPSMVHHRFRTDYLEKSFAGWAAQLPDGMGLTKRTRLGLRATGFIGTMFIAHGQDAVATMASSRAHSFIGAIRKRKVRPIFLACYRLER